MSNQFSSFSWLSLVLEMEQRGLVKRTFRRLDPPQQQKILLAILDEAAERGPQALNIKNVAARAGVSVGSLYQYFGSRDRLLGFTVELVVRATVGEFHESAPYLNDMPLKDALPTYLTAGVDWSREQLGFARFFGAAAYHGSAEMGERVVQPIAREMLSLVRGMLQAAQERGEIRPGVDLEAAARLANCLMIAVGDAQLLPSLNHYYQLFDESMPPGRILAALVDLIFRGVAQHENIADCPQDAA